MRQIKTEKVMNTSVKKIPAKGRFLLARPFLADSNFWRTVVLLVEHGDEGTVGFVLNKPTEHRLNELFPDLPAFDAPLYLGGPVATDSLQFIHRIPDLDEDDQEIRPGVYWGANFEALRPLILSGQLGPNDVRFFLGYSGWEVNQLDMELKMKSWFVSDPKSSFTFSEDPENLWKDILQTMGDRYRVISHYPEDPILN